MSDDRRIFGTTRWRSYALVNAGMTFDSTGDAKSATDLYIRALEVDEGNIAARLNLGALLLESEGDGVHSAIRQLTIAKKEAVIAHTPENDPVFYSASFRLAAAHYQQGNAEAALNEAKSLRSEIRKSMREIRKRRRPHRWTLLRWQMLRSIPAVGHALAHWDRKRVLRTIARDFKNDILFSDYLRRLGPSVTVMIAGLKRDLGKVVKPPRIADRDLWRPSAAFQYNLACTATIWFKAAAGELDRVMTEATRKRDHHTRQTKEQLIEAFDATREWESQKVRWREDALSHLRFALRLNPRLSVWAKKDLSMKPLHDDAAFKELTREYAPPAAAQQATA